MDATRIQYKILWKDLLARRIMPILVLAKTCSVKKLIRMIPRLFSPLPPLRLPETFISIKSSEKRFPVSLSVHLPSKLHIFARNGCRNTQIPLAWARWRHLQILVFLLHFIYLLACKDLKCAYGVGWGNEKEGKIKGKQRRRKERDTRKKR